MGVWNPWRDYLNPRTYNIHKQNIDLISGTNMLVDVQCNRGHRTGQVGPPGGKSELFITKWRSTGRCDNHECGKVCQTYRVVIKLPNLNSCIQYSSENRQYSQLISSQIYWNCVTAPCIFISMRCFLRICLNTFTELASLIYIGISFQIVAPWIFKLNFLTSSLANRTCKSFDCRVFMLWSSLFFWKKSLNISGTPLLQYL